MIPLQVLSLIDAKNLILLLTKFFSCVALSSCLYWDSCYNLIHGYLVLYKIIYTSVNFINEVVHTL
ncbi:hypothetical protein BDF21DRAFT_414352 [Thamnidium elegans]|nr:hypothetical protein BDF21DRAFT_414352 [Thamnidium elegans]